MLHQSISAACALFVGAHEPFCCPHFCEAPRARVVTQVGSDAARRRGVRVRRVAWRLCANSAPPRGVARTPKTCACSSGLARSVRREASRLSATLEQSSVATPTRVAAPARQAIAPEKPISKAPRCELAAASFSRTTRRQAGMARAPPCLCMLAPLAGPCPLSSRGRWAASPSVVLSGLRRARFRTRSKAAQRPLFGWAKTNDALQSLWCRVHQTIKPCRTSQQRAERHARKRKRHDATLVDLPALWPRGPRSFAPSPGAPNALLCRAHSEGARSDVDIGVLIVRGGVVGVWIT